MKCFKYKSNKTVNFSLSEYAVDWQGDSASKFQTKVKNFLFPYWKSHIVLEEFRIPGCLLRCDFLNYTKMIAVEANGSQHEKFNKFFHQDSRAKYFQSIKRDFEKIEWLEREGFTVVEIVEGDIKDLSVDFFKLKFNIDL